MKIAVLVSGGVDSSVALQLLKEQGHELTAFYLKIWLEDELAYLGQCPWQEDLSYVEKVCSQLDIPLQVVSMQEDYWQRVVSYTISEVKAGRTPSPDILCNQFIKFGAFYAAIDDSYQFVATGHYAQVEHTPGGSFLEKAKDPVKDQTYFLSRLTQQQLARALFPIGHLEKAEVRALARKHNLANQDRKDSQGICFLGKFKFADFIRHHVGNKPGDLIEVETGKVVGQHEGFWFYTIGQRKGIGLSGGPWFVVRKDVKANIVYISNNYYDPDKARNQFTVTDCRWISGQTPGEHCDVKLRHGERIYQGASIGWGDEEKTKAHVILAGNDQGIAPGQFAVFYEGDLCLGAGVIEGDV